MLFALSGCMTFAVNAVMSVVFGFYFDAMISYNTVFVLSGAVCLVLAFRGLEIGTSRVINSIASKSFIVYIIHENPVLKRYAAEQILHLPEMDGLRLTAAMFLLPAAVYALCFAVDTVMDLLLRPAERIVEKWAGRAFARLRRAAGWD